MTDYRATYQQLLRIEAHPRISGTFAVEKRLWAGRKVAVHWMKHRGKGGVRGYTTDMRISYGTLVLNPNGAEAKTVQIGVKDERTGEVHVIAASRCKDIYDMTRTK
jgi:hypothetical protein